MTVVECIIIWSSKLLVVATFPISLWFCFKQARDYERAIIYRLGRLRTVAEGPGTFFVLPCTDSCHIVDLRVRTLDIPSQTVLLTSSHATAQLSMGTLRGILGSLTYMDLLTERKHISDMIQSVLSQTADSWGIKVEHVELTDISICEALTRIMAVEAEAVKAARSKVVAAESEVQSSKALKEAADIVSGSPTALQFRYLQTVHKIALKHNKMVTFPLPVNVIRHLLNIHNE